MKKIQFILSGFILLFATLLAGQRDGLGYFEGEIDATFADNGIFTFRFGADYYAYDAALQSDGKLVVVGMVEFGSYQEVLVMRINPDGELDHSFQSLGFEAYQATDSDYEYARAVQIAGNKILVGGYSGGKGFVLRLNTDGSLDSGFGAGGVKVLDDLLVVNDLATIPGVSTYHIVVAGSVISGWDSRPALMKLSESGSVLNSFGSGGIAVPPASVKGFFNDLHVSTLGSLTVCGTVRADGVADDEALVAKFSGDGDLSTSFGGGAGYVIVEAPVPGSRNNGEAMHVGSDGKIIVCGDYLAGSDNDAYAFRLNSNGTLDDSFGDSGYYASGYGGETDEMNDIAVQPAGEIIIGGRSDYQGTFNFNISRLLTNALLDPDFGTGSWVMTDIDDSDDEIHRLLIKINTTSSSYLYAVGNSAKGSNHSIAVVRYLILIIGVREPNVLDFSLSPNPVTTGQVFVRFQLPEAAEVSIQLQTMEGRTLYELLKTDLPGGPQEEELTIPACPAGAYILHIQAGNAVHSELLIVH